MRNSQLAEFLRIIVQQVQPLEAIHHRLNGSVGIVLIEGSLVLDAQFQFDFLTARSQGFQPLAVGVAYQGVDGSLPAITELLIILVVHTFLHVKAGGHEWGDNRH